MANQVSFGSDNGLVPNRQQQTITWAKKNAVDSYMHNHSEL